MKLFRNLGAAGPQPLRCLLALAALALSALGPASPGFAADLSITAANVVAGTGADVDQGRAGAAVTAGQVVYKEAATGRYKLADDNSATAEVRSPDGIALNGAANGQPLAVLRKGEITIGATLTAGVVYYLSDTPGGLSPVADLASGEYPTVVGIARSTSVLSVSFLEAGVVL